MTEPQQESPKVIIRGISRQYDGDYDLEFRRAFTVHDWRIIKKVSGYMPLTLEQGWRGGDPDVRLAFAMIALCRAGKVHRDDALAVADELAETEWDGASIKIVFPAGDEARPPALTSEPDAPSENGTSSLTNPSGESSSPSSAPSETTPVSTGTPESESRSTSPLLTSRT